MNLQGDYVKKFIFFNTPTQAESLLHSLEQAAGDIGPYVNAKKMEYMCFNQEGAISTLNSGSLKLVDKFMYLGSSISYTESDVNFHLAKAWTAIDRLLIICKSDLSDKIKRDFFQDVILSILLNGYTTWMLLEVTRKWDNSKVIENYPTGNGRMPRDWHWARVDLSLSPFSTNSICRVSGP